MRRRPGATPTRKRNWPGINVFLLLAGNQRENRKQKPRSAPAPFAPRPGCARSRPCARPQRVLGGPARLVPRASRLEPRPRPGPHAPQSWRLGGAGLGVAGGPRRRWSRRCAALRSARRLYERGAAERPADPGSAGWTRVRTPSR